MGEMADALIDDTMDAFPEWSPFGSPRQVTPPAVCKYCGKSPLQWSLTPSGWRLFGKKGKIHVCEKYVRKVTRVE